MRRKETENEFILRYARKWNEEIADITKSSDGTWHYTGWVHLKFMLKAFLRAYKRREK